MPPDNNTTSPKVSKAGLSRDHRRMLCEESGIDPGVASERGYRTITRRDELTEYPGWQRRLGLYVPNHSPSGETVQCQLRPDERRKNGPKYESPQGSGVILDVHPRMREEVRHGTGPLDITEGVKTGDSNTSRGRPTVVLNGVWGWKVAKTHDDLLPCWDYVNLDGREVNIIFDGDVMTKREVQQALERFAPALEARGADVWVTYLPDGLGLDDYYAAGHTIAEREMLSRRYGPDDIGNVRMAADAGLRDAIDTAWASWWAFDWARLVGAGDRPHWMRGHSARDVEKVAIDAATKSGVAVEDGIYFSLDARSWAEAAASRKQTVLNSIKHLEAEGRIRRYKAEREEGKAAGYVLLTVYSSPYQLGERESGRGRADCLPCVISDPTGTDLSKPVSPSAPRLRWSAPKFTRNPDGGYEREYIRRLGKHNGAIVDLLLRVGGVIADTELADALGKRLWNLQTRNLPLLEERGIIELDGDTVRLVSDWLEALEADRRLMGEIEAAERDHTRHKIQREAYRARNDNLADYSPTEAEMDRAREARERRRRAEDEQPISYLAAALRIYLHKSPHHAEQPANWLTTAMWADGWLDRNPAPAESKAALEALGGRAFIERITREEMSA